MGLLKFGTGFIVGALAGGAMMYYASDYKPTEILVKESITLEQSIKDCYIQQAKDPDYFWQTADKVALELGLHEKK